MFPNIHDSLATPRLLPPPFPAHLSVRVVLRDVLIISTDHASSQQLQPDQCNRTRQVGGPCYGKRVRSLFVSITPLVTVTAAGAFNVIVSQFFDIYLFNWIVDMYYTRVLLHVRTFCTPQGLGAQVHSPRIQYTQIICKCVFVGQRPMR